MNDLIKELLVVLLALLAMGYLTFQVLELVFNMGVATGCLK